MLPQYCPERSWHFILVMSRRLKIMLRVGTTRNDRKKGSLTTNSSRETSWKFDPPFPIEFARPPPPEEIESGDQAHNFRSVLKSVCLPKCSTKPHENGKELKGLEGLKALKGFNSLQTVTVCCCSARFNECSLSCAVVLSSCEASQAPPGARAGQAAGKKDRTSHTKRKQTAQCTT